MNANEIVARLLEDGPAPRVCASCQREFGFTPPPGASHGFCRRHYVEYLAREMGLSQAEAEASAAQADQTSVNPWCPDAGQQNAA